jgi:hypothetical protein
MGLVLFYSILHLLFWGAKTRVYLFSILAMGSFLKRLGGFLLLLALWSALFWVLAEVVLLNLDLTFAVKARHFDKNAGKIDVLILGSSHHENGLNPADFKDYTCSNLAFAGQDLRIDSAIFRNVISKIKQVEFVVLELSYHSLEQRLDKHFANNGLYLKFYGINLFERSARWIDYSVYASDPMLYNKILNPFQDRPKTNEFGFQTQLKKDFMSNRFQMLDYHKERILKDSTNHFIGRHKYEDSLAYSKNRKTLFSLIEHILSSGKIPILMSPPVYSSYRAAYIPEKQNRRRKCIEDIQKKHLDLIYIDLDADPRFELVDFRDEDHLNPSGAQKLSKIMNDTLVHFEKQSRCE